MKKNKDLLFLLIVVIVLSVSIFMFIKPKISKKNLSKTIINYDQSEEYSFLYFDKSIDFKKQGLYNSLISDNVDLVKLMKDYNLTIVISPNEIRDVYYNLLKFTTPKITGMVGLCLDNPDLIIVKDYKPEDEIIAITPEMIETATGDYKDFIEDKESYRLRDLYTLEDLNTISERINGRVLYHEIGHFLVNKKGLSLLKDDSFKEAYKTEKDKIFPEEDDYNKSDINEYVAECISNYLNYGYVEYKNDSLEKNSTKTGQIIENFILNLKK